LPSATRSSRVSPSRAAWAAAVGALAALPLAAGCGGRAGAVDLLQARDRLVEADVGGRGTEWVERQIGKPVRIDDVVLRTLPASPPSRLVYDLEVPRDGRLSLSYAVTPEHHGRPPVEFRVRVAEAGGERLLWSSLLDPLGRPGHRTWQHAGVDLIEYAGRRVSLVLETGGYDEDPREARRAVWGAPALNAADPHAQLAVVYLVDTLRADHTTVYGYERETTPRLEAFAGDSVVFEAAVAHASWTKPSVASLFTSQLPGRHLTVQLRDPLAPGQLTLAEMLQARGVATGAVIANSVIYGDGNHFEQGFDGFFGLHDAEGRISKSVDADRVVDTALAWLRTRQGLPTFLYVHTMDPHVPYEPPPPFDTRWGPATTPEHPGVDPRTDYHEPLDRERLVGQYDGEIAYGDREFGRLLDELRDLGLYERALLLFTADHGEEFLDHGQWLHGRTLFDELIRVPLLLKLPGRAAAGRRIQQQVQLVDVLPTVLRHLELPVPPPPVVMGQPLQEVIAGGVPEPHAIAEVSHRGIVAHGVRTRRDKYVRHFSPEATEYYFDLGSDPGERENRIAEHRDRVREMSGRVEAAMARDPNRRVLRFEGDDTWELVLRTAGWIDGVEPVGFGGGDRYEVENNGRRLALRVSPRPGQPRELSFSVRPIGAPTWLEGARNGRPLRVGDLRLAEEGIHPPEIPARLPETESETEEGVNVLAPPRQGGPGIQVWLKPALGREQLELNAAQRQQLCALGYIAC
jgi:arylsulfatase A-like enzyme